MNKNKAAQLAVSLAFLAGVTVGCARPDPCLTLPAPTPQELAVVQNGREVEAEVVVNGTEYECDLVNGSWQEEPQEG